jgi:hypothetical protein
MNPVQAFREKLSMFPINLTYVVYCRLLEAVPATFLDPENNC